MPVTVTIHSDGGGVKLSKQKNEVSRQTQHNNTMQMDNDTEKARAAMVMPDFRGCLYLRTTRFVSAAPETLRIHFLHHPISLDVEIVGGFGPPNKLARAPFSSGLNIMSAVFHNVPVRKGIIIYTHASACEIKIGRQKQHTWSRTAIQITEAHSIRSGTPQSKDTGAPRSACRSFALWDAFFPGSCSIGWTNLLNEAKKLCSKRRSYVQ